MWLASHYAPGIYPLYPWLLRRLYFWRLHLRRFYFGQCYFGRLQPWATLGKDITATWTCMLPNLWLYRHLHPAVPYIIPCSVMALTLTRSLEIRFCRTCLSPTDLAWPRQRHYSSLDLRATDPLTVQASASGSALHHAVLGYGIGPQALSRHLSP